MVVELKKKLRKQYLEIRMECAESGGDEAAVAMAEKFLEQGPFSDLAVISGYYPVKSEIDVLCLLDKAHHFGYHTALPAIIEKAKPLVFRKWRQGEDLYLDPKYNIHEPYDIAKEVVPDIILVPLLAFDGKGHRLGYGGGYYDRTITKLRSSGKVQVIGCAYEAQYIDELPSAEHDQILDAVVTEEKYWLFSA